MFEASKYITNTISEIIEVSEELTGGLSWEISASDVKKPFMNFNLIENPGRTKDGGNEYTVSFFVFADTLSQSSQIGDLLKQKIKENSSLGWKFVRSSNGYTSDEAQEAFIEVVFNFNHK